MRSLRSSPGLPAIGQTGFANLMTVAAGGLSGIVVARTLNATGRGELAIVMVAVQLIAPLVTLGIEESAVLLVGQATEEEERRAAISSALVTAVVLGSIGVAIALALQSGLFLERVRSVDSVVMLAYCGTAVLLTVSSVALGILRGLQKYATWNVCRLGIPSIYLAAVIAIVLTDRVSVTAYVVAMPVAVAVTCLALLLIVIPQGLAVPRAMVVGRLVNLGLGNHFITMQNVANQRLDHFLLAALVPAAAVGHYAVATTYASLGLAVGLVPSTQAYSHFSRTRTVDRGIYLGALRRTWLIMVVVAIASSVIAPWVIPGVFGDSFRGAVVPAAILLLGVPFVAVNALHVSTWKAVGRPWPAARAEFLGLAINVAAMLVLIPLLGILGAAVASVIAYWSVRYFLRRAGYPG